MVLPAGRPVAALADRDFLGFPARHLDDRRRDEIVIEDDIGRLQDPQRLQRQKLRIAGTCADERDRARRRACGASPQTPASKRSRSPSSGRRLPRIESSALEMLPERTARLGGERELRELAPPRLRGLRPERELARQKSFEPAAQRLRQHRRGAVGRDPEDKRGAIDDRPEAEIGIVGSVDHVQGNAGRRRGCS